MVNHLLETSHPLSSSALHFCGPVPEPSPILRTLFQVPYPVSPLLATLTKSAGVWGYSSHFGSPRTTCAKGTRSSLRSTFQSKLLSTSAQIPIRSGCSDSSMGVLQPGRIYGTLSTFFATSLLPYLLPPSRSVSSPCPVDRLPNAGDNSNSAQTLVGAPISEEEVNEHFSKRTEPGGVVPLRIDGDTEVDRRAVWRGDCRAGGAGLCQLFDAVAHEHGPGKAAGAEQDFDGATGPGEFAHRGFEEPDGADHAASGIDAV